MTATGRSIVEWAFQDPVYRAGQALAALNELADTITDPAEQAQIADSSLMVSRLARSAGVLEMAVRFNPDELRNARGEWSVTPGGPVRRSISDWQDEFRDLDDLVSDNPSQAEGDLALTRITREQGFDRPPERGSVAATVAAGGTELWRGIYDSKGRAPGWARAFLDGTDGNRQGLGMEGNGTYFATGQKIAGEYASPGAMIHAALKPGSRIADHDQLFAQWEKSRHGMAEYDQGYKTTADLGRWAAMQGYDAIAAKFESTTDPDAYVVLNRGALVVDK